MARKCAENLWCGAPYASPEYAYGLYFEIHNETIAKIIEHPVQLLFKM